MLLALCVHSHESRRKISDRQRIHGLLQSILRQGLSEEAATHLRTWDVDPTDAALCTAPPLQNGNCNCVIVHMTAHLRPAADGQHECVQDYAARALEYLHGVRVCPALRAHFHRILLLLGSLVDGLVQRWGDFDWHRGEAARLQGVARPRRADRHAQEFALSRSTELGLTATVGEAARSMASSDGSLVVKWCSRHLSAYRVSSRMSMAEAQTLSITFDASRVGRPARDYLVILASDPRRNRHCALPPQALWRG